MQHHEETVAELSNGRFRTCLSDSISGMFSKCVSLVKSEAESSLDNSNYMCPAGSIIMTTLPHNIPPESFEFYSIFRLISQQSLAYMQCPHDSVNVLPGPDSSEVVYLALKYTTLLESEILSLVGGKTSLLKDALHHDSLLIHFPQLCVDFLKLLFLPQGLNFRNIIWHGFAAPEEMDPCFCAMLMSLHKSICTVSRKVQLSRKVRKVAASDAAQQDVNAPRPTSSPCITLQTSFEGYSTLTLPFTRLELSSMLFENDQPSTPLDHFLKSSSFVLPGREALVESALRDYCHGRPVSCLMKLIPCLEHSLRMLFCLSNHMHEYIMADVDVYYSTLDGFGQRSKHQLLLDPYCFEYNRELGTSTRSSDNKLLTVLGEGLYSLLVDLFFAETGPNVRARIAHGINIQYDEVSESVSKQSGMEMANVVVALYFALSKKFYKLKKSKDNEGGKEVECILPSFESYPIPSVTSMDSQAKTSASESIFNSEIQSCCDVCSNWQSLYHPNRILSRLLQEDTVQALFKLSELIEHRNLFCLSRKAESCDSAVHIGIFHRLMPPSSDSPACQELITEFSDKKNKIYSNFLHVIDNEDCSNGSLSSASWSTIETPGSPDGDDIRSHMKDKLPSVLSHDVIRSCNDFTSIAVTAMTRATHGIEKESCSRGGEHDIKGLEALHHLQGLVSQSAVQCHNCLLPPYCTSTTAANREIGDNVKIDHFNLVLDSYLRKYCGPSSTPIQGLTCCVSVLNHISELCTKLHESIMYREALLTSSSSHTADRRQYLLQLLCLSPVVQSFTTFILSVIVVCIYHTHLSVNMEGPCGRDPPNLTPLFSGLASATASFSSCVFTSGSQSAKKNPEVSLAQLQKFLDSKSVKKYIVALEKM
mmetsp:Transcript_18633/g.34806  ORF Transcript_18633/g.34806 Transcript_18633/m.34806 type:complete len:876 (+) Transcript_18633:94-2721(+)